jgi:sulfofructose kinase
VWVDGDDVRSLAAFDVDAVDTTGAGDVFHGAVTLALAEGADEARAFAFASAAAALKCTRPGARAGVPSRPEVDDLLDRTPIADEVAAR